MEQDGLQFEIGPSRSLFGSSLCQGSDRLWRRRVVNGVNIIKWNDGGQIVEFKVMPLRTRFMRRRFVCAGAWWFVGSAYAQQSASAARRPLTKEQVDAFVGSRRLNGKINGRAAEMFDMGLGGLMVPMSEIDRLGLRSRLKSVPRQVGGPDIWVLESASVEISGQPFSLPIFVGDPRMIAEQVLGAGQPRR